MSRMMIKAGATLDDNGYKTLSNWTANFYKKSLRNYLEHGEKTTFEADILKYKRGRSSHCAYGPVTEMQPMPGTQQKWEQLENEKFARFEFASKIIQKMFHHQNKEFGLEKSGGVTSALGFNFYDLRGPALILAPINVPFRNSIPRVGRVNDGYGTAANWKASRNLGQNYGGVAEGQRNATQTPDEIDYTATYKQIGNERAVTTSAEFASEGYSAQLGDEHVRGMLSLWLSEEAINIHGNSGTAATGGYALGTATTPTIATATGTSTFGGATPVSVACVYMTAMGNPSNNQYGYMTNLVANANTVTGGLVPNTVRTNADGSVITVPGGISAISAMSSVVTPSGTTQVAVATVPAGTKGVYGYAWYVNVTDAAAPSLANAKLAAITQFPTYTITSATIAGTQTGNATGLNTDNSYSQYDYTGLMGFAAGTAGSYYKDLGGGTLTPTKTGKIVEIETALQTMFLNYQTGINAIWGSQDAIEAVDLASRWGGSNGQAQQFFFNGGAGEGGRNLVVAGYAVTGYQSRYAAANELGAQVIPLRIHPMIPPGTLFFDISELPAGYENSRLPYLRAMLTRRDYHSYEWPMVTRQWTFGTYAEQVLAHNMPWACGVITGISGANLS
jgi:hypothetical protein